MKITGVKTVLLTGPMSNDPSNPAGRRFRSASFIELHTDTELIGIGESYLGYHLPEIVPTVVDFFAPIITNAENPFDIHTLRQRMFDCCAYWGRVGVAPTVMSGIEAALWDLKGKAYGLPVHELIGGRHADRLPAYATGGGSQWPIEHLFRKVDHYLDIGFTGFKVGAGFQDVVTGATEPLRSVNEIVEFEAAKVEALRGHVGKDVRILLDAHMGFRSGLRQWDVATAKRVLDAVEPFDIFFFEEPLHYTNDLGYGELTRSTGVKVAGGESLTSFEEFRRFADVGAFDIAQPDSAWIGMVDFVDVGKLFALQGKWVASHAWGSGAAVMQNIHAAFATPNTAILEIPPAAGPLHTEVWGDSLRLVDGMIDAPDAPGLGVRLPDDLKERYPFVPGTGEFVSVPGKQVSR